MVLSSFTWFETAQVVLMLKGGGCGVAALPPHHTPPYPLAGCVVTMVQALIAFSADDASRCDAQDAKLRPVVVVPARVCCARVKE